MIGKRTEEIRAATLAEVKDILEARASQPDFGYEQQTSLDYSKKFAKIEKKKALELVDELMKYETMKFEAAVKIADILPSRASQLGAIIAKDKVLLKEKETAEVLALVAKYRA